MKVGKFNYRGRTVECKIIGEGATTYRIRVVSICNGRYNGVEEFTVPKEEVTDIRERRVHCE